MGFSIDPLAGALGIFGLVVMIATWVARVHYTANKALDGVARIEEARKVDKLAYDLRLTAAEGIAGDLKAIRESLRGMEQRATDSQKFYAGQFEDLRDNFQREIDRLMSGRVASYKARVPK